MTPSQEFAGMVARVEAALKGTRAGYTPKIRKLEDDADQANRGYLYSRLHRNVISSALGQLELAWMTEIAKARRLAQGASR